MILLVALLSILTTVKDVTLVFAGDAMQHQSQLDNARRGSNRYDYSGTFDSIAPWVREADYAIVNLETTLGQSNFSGYPCFSSPDAYAAALRDAGFNLFLTANNHTLDRRDKGLRRTIAVLDSLHVDHIGTYTDAEHRADAIPFVKNINGFRVGFLNYTYGTNGIRVQGNVVVDYIDRDRIKHDIAATRQAGAEIIVALPHWGIEYKLQENQAQRELAQFMLDQGVDIVMGGHPHVIQPMHIRYMDSGKQDQRLVVYSMGNFISGMRTTDTRGGAMVKVRLTRDAHGRARMADAEYRLVFTIPGSPGKRNNHLIFLDPETDVDRAAGSMTVQAKAFLHNALNIFDKYNTDVPRYVRPTLPPPEPCLPTPDDILYPEPAPGPQDLLMPRQNNRHQNLFHLYE